MKHIISCNIYGLSSQITVKWLKCFFCLVQSTVMSLSFFTSGSEGWFLLATPPSWLTEESKAILRRDFSDLSIPFVYLTEADFSDIAVSSRRRFIFSAHASLYSDSTFLSWFSSSWSICRITRTQKKYINIRGRRMLRKHGRQTLLYEGKEWLRC